MRGWKTTSKTIGSTVLAGWILVEALKPGSTERYKPSSEGIFTADILGASSNSKIPNLKIDGKYTCEVQEKLQTKQRTSSHGSQFIASSLKWNTINLTIKVNNGSKSITLVSNDPDFNKTLSFTYQQGGETSYQEGHSVFGYLANNTSLMYNSDRIMIMFDHWFSGSSGRSKFGTCQITPSNPPTDGLVRGVFIRPCEGDFYKAFPKKKNDAAVTNVADGTVAGACKDLKDSGVTDVFLPFKVDDATYSHCGQYGELLYNSAQHADRINAKFKAEYALDFDPIKALMNACQGLRFHAWFPVFNDPYAATMGGQKATFDPVTTVLKIPSGVTTFQSSVFADPDRQLVIFYELTLLDELVKAYPVVGINLDYIRYADTQPIADEYAAYKTQNQITDSSTITSVVINATAIENFVSLVRQRFPGLILSADVRASSGARQGVGQDGILNSLNWIMPMEYSYFGLGGSDDVQKWASVLKSTYQNKTVVPLLRGWLCKINAGCVIPRFETKDTFKDHLAADITAVTAIGIPNHGVFTYEVLLKDSGSKNLSGLKQKLGW